MQRIIPLLRSCFYNVRSCFYNIRQLRAIRTCLTHDALRDAAYALVLSRIDYCNSLYAHLPINLVDRLQTLMNTAARVISGRPRFGHITDFIQNDLHWLPVAQRIQFKLATLVYKAQHNQAPAYLTNMIVLSSSVMYREGLRSPSLSAVVVPRHRTQFAERAFAIAGPTIWNSLPQSIRDAATLQSFRQKLKSYLFELAYRDST